MCGIAGEVYSVQAKELCRIYKTQNIERMISALEHRGPDDRAYHWDTFTCQSRQISIRLGMSRLAIIDREHGQQPFGDRCKAFFNGEIYNHREIRSDLRMYSQEYHCKTDCDSEVVAKLYEKNGDSFVRNLDGMFAIAIWDQEEKILKLWRDRIGKKPLYYYHDEQEGIFLFASEIKAILTHPAYKKEINTNAIYKYLSMQYVPEPETAFAGIKQVFPGCWLYYNPALNEIATVGYWDLIPDDSIYKSHSRHDWMNDIQVLMHRAVNKRLESEVPLGVYLSGGIDSAIVTALASQHVKELHTFTMAFLEDEFNEAPAARRVAHEFNTIHHEETVTSVDLINMAREIVKQYDQPFGDFSAIPTMLLARLSKKYITVALTGDGGDEAFGGYPRYWMCAGREESYWKYVTVIHPAMIEGLVPSRRLPDHLTDPEMYIMQNLPLAQMNDNRATSMMYCDMKTYLVNDIIVKMERATMASSVEARCPFLDPGVLQLGLSTPADLKLGKSEGKLILKSAFEKYLPAEILKLPKRGFSVPMDQWLRQSEGLILLNETLLEKNNTSGIDLVGIDRPAVGQLVRSHLVGASNMGHALWILIMLDLWIKEHF